MGCEMVLVEGRAVSVSRNAIPLKSCLRYERFDVCVKEVGPKLPKMLGRAWV